MRKFYLLLAIAPFVFFAACGGTPKPPLEPTNPLEGADSGTTDMPTSTATTPTADTTPPPPTATTPPPPEPKDAGAPEAPKDAGAKPKPKPKPAGKK